MPNYIKVVLAETKEFGHFVLQTFVGTEREARTPDTWFWRPVLYQLS